MTKTAALGSVDQATRTAFLSLQKRVLELESNAYRELRNFADNGAMNVSQRGTSNAGVTASTLLLDRWSLNLSALGTWTLSQTTDGPAQTEFVKCFKVLCTTADASPAAGDVALITTGFEGQFLQRLLWGTTGALPVTLSFWVKSNKVGTYVAELYRVEATHRHIGAAYKVNVTDTWEKKTITFPGDQTTVPTNDVANRLAIDFWLASGSTYNGGAALQTAWGNLTNNVRAFGNVNVAAATNNYFQITGVQLEIGTEARSFESRPYDMELRRAMRYYQQWTQPPLRGAMPSTANAVAGRLAMALLVPMRAAPTGAISGALPIYDGVSTGTADSINATFCTATVAEFNFNTTIVANAVASARPIVVYQNGTNSLTLTADI